MLSPFLSKEYLAAALLKAKYEVFRDSFITVDELNQFNHFIQTEFNKQNLGIVITSNSLSRENFNIIDGVIIPTESCCFDVDRLPSEILSILMDKNLILEFFIELENRKLETLENLQNETTKSEKRKKIMSLVLPKISGTGISNLKV